MFRKLSLALAVSAALSPVGALALGLGDIVTRSALNENFKADIELVSAQSGEIDTIRAALASPSDFARAGLDRPFLLSRLRFQALELEDGRSVIRVTTKDPVREPFLDFLVEVNWPKGRLLREFTVLLDPPTTLDRPPAPVAPARTAPIPVVNRPSSPVDAGQVETPVYRPPAYRAPVNELESRGLEPTVGEYGPVESGSTLWGIANQLQISGATTEQMAMALYRANPDAFANNNINNLLKGAVLRVPEREEILADSPASARSDFRLAAKTGTSPDGSDRLVLATRKQDDERRRAADSRTPGGEIEQVKTDLMMVRETSESTRQETENLRARIRELESRLADIRQLLQLKSDQLAQLQSSRPSASGIEPNVPVVEEPPRVEPLAPEPAVALPEPAVERETADDTAAIMPETLARPEPAPEVAAETQPPIPETTPESIAPEPPVEQVVEARPEPAPVTTAPVSQAKPAPQPNLVTKTSPAEASPGLLDEILANPMYLAAGGGGVIVLLLLAWLLMRRRQQAEDEFNESVLFNPDEATTEEMGQPSREKERAAAVEGDEETSFISDFSPSDIDALQEETGEVDPAAEADVYIAYGRYQQAESLINQALEKAPERKDLKAKLLEIHFTTRDTAAFTGLAKELYDAGVPNSDPGMWGRIASMGNELAPDNLMFQGAEPIQSDVAVGGDEPRPEQDGDVPPLGQDDLLTDSEALASLDLDLDTELSELPDEPMGGFSELMLPDEDTASTIEPPSKAVIGEEHESTPLSASGKSSGMDEMSEFSLDLDDLDSLEGIDLGDTGGADQPDLGEPSGLSELGSEMRMSAFSETDDSHIQPEEDIPAISLDDLDDAVVSAGDSGGEPLSELLQEDDRSEEIETKLDLARAYVEMEDSEGASEILSEILEEGDDAQRDQAKQLLNELK